jgi:hypothetical protein
MFSGVTILRELLSNQLIIPLLLKVDAVAVKMIPFNMQPPCGFGKTFRLGRGLRILGLSLTKGR